MLGLTFKPDTDDMREAPSVPLIETLQRYGAIVRAYDPVGLENAARMLEDVTFLDDPYECARNSDAVVVLTEWDSIRRIDLGRLRRLVRTPVLVDLRNALEPGAASAAGFHVSVVGQCSEHAEWATPTTDEPDFEKTASGLPRMLRGK